MVQKTPESDEVEMPSPDSLQPETFDINRPGLSMGKKRVLVVEDNCDTRELMALVIGKAGYEVVEASTGFEAIDQARTARPALIIMDLALPGMTGVEAIARLKEDPSTLHIPVIVNTAYPNGSPFVERALAAGAAEIWYKPNNFPAIRETLKRYLSSEEPASFKEILR
jgi:two-component system cell cycle response regulator DivK